MTALYLGLISGTSLDGVDCVLVDLDEDRCRLVAAATRPYDAALAERLTQIIAMPRASLRALGSLDRAVGEAFAAGALEILATAGCRASDVRAIGHHGQTVFHEPDGPEPFTLQIGDPNVVAAATGITTVADFRRLDMALGGQGAPLVPAFHSWRFRALDETRAVANIGGIANITVLAPGHETTGFDSGPGNTLLDLWIRRCRGEAFDRGGAWAAQGKVDARLLERLLVEPYFTAPAPKSTGRELFNLAWLEPRLAAHGTVADVDVQATLAELTATTIAAAVDHAARGANRLVVCGGGAHNADLLDRLARNTGLPVATTDAYGVPADWVEGAAFAWLAKARLDCAAGNVTAVTGARRAAVLGGVYWGAPPKTSP